MHEDVDERQAHGGCVRRRGGETPGEAREEHEEGEEVGE